MADARSLKEILEELFKGQDAALTKYAKVRMTQYELSLWRQHGLPLGEVDGSAKQYFSKRFLAGARIDKADEKTLEKALSSLDHAVKDGCHGRCTKLVDELNEALKDAGLDTLRDPESFLNWLTFNYKVRKDDHGNAVIEKPFGFEIRVFDSDQNRKEFWEEVQLLLKQGRMMSMQNIGLVVSHKRKNSKDLSR